jgi:hypothetical protein
MRVVLVPCGGRTISVRVRVRVRVRGQVKSKVGAGGARGKGWGWNGAGCASCRLSLSLSLSTSLSCRSPTPSSLSPQHLLPSLHPATLSSSGLVQVVQEEEKVSVVQFIKEKIKTSARVDVVVAQGEEASAAAAAGKHLAQTEEEQQTRRRDASHDDKLASDMELVLAVSHLAQSPQHPKAAGQSTEARCNACLALLVLALVSHYAMLVCPCLLTQLCPILVSHLPPSSFRHWSISGGR